MTTRPHHHLQLTTVDTQHGIRIEIRGDLDHTGADLLIDEVTAQLAGRPALADLHLHCAGLGTVDSMGLSALLMISRRTTAAGVRLHVDDRPAKLDRLLDITGTRAYLGVPPAVSASESPMPQDRALPARLTRPDRTT